MSWMEKLYETYEACEKLNLSDAECLMPINHTLQNAHINIVIDEKGNFKRALVLEKTQVVLPVTEKSDGRTQVDMPHPLVDRIQYVAKDYRHYGDSEKSYFDGYEKQLADWCESKFGHPKAVAVLAYVRQGTVIKDLISEGILHIDGFDKLLAYWPDEEGRDIQKPLIFKVLPPLEKAKRKNKDKPEVELGNALVCWSVEKKDEPDSDTWTDKSLQQSWIDYEVTVERTEGLCYISGQKKPLATKHPAKLRHTGDKAKLISSNDRSGFTFRGRFTDATGMQASGISAEVTQKAHNALRWLITRQGRREGDQVYVAWAVSGKAIPDPLKDSWAMLMEKPELQQKNSEEKSRKIDHTIDMGESFAHDFNKYISGYRINLKPNEQIVVMGIDSATPGRMGIIYYRELLASEFLDRIGDWHLKFAWPQRYSREYPNPKEGGKVIKKIIWPVSSPVPWAIAEAAYGDILKSNKMLKKSVLERILPSIIDGRPFPRDIMISAVRRVCNRNSCENWEFERNLGIACSLYKGYYLRNPNKKERKTYDMALEETRNTRDYLYGRLLAIAERIENMALNVAGEKRTTTVARMMQRFADHPFSTWRNIELGLQPYMQRLHVSRGGFLTNSKREIDTVQALFETPEAFVDDSPLSGEFLLGYHCQKQYWQNNKQSKDNQENEGNKNESE